MPPSAPRRAVTLVALCLMLIIGVTAESEAALPAGWHKGANLTNAAPDQYASPASDAAIRALRASGSSHAALVPLHRMRTGQSSAIERGAATPTKSSLRHATATAKALGMHVTLKPHIDVDDGTWRGQIAPACRSCWWSSYRSMIYAYATLAQRTGVKLLAIGTELESMQRDTANWRQLIRGVRRRFSGKLTYAANAIPQNVAFWDALDFIGSDFYLPLVEDSPNPSVDRLVEAWHARGYVRSLAALHARWRKPILFTEIGYRSIEWTTKLPWEWQTSQTGAQEPQERAYEAAYRVWSRRPWFAGLYWWDWQPWGGPGDDAFTARDKSAEAVMRSWNR